MKNVIKILMIAIMAIGVSSCDHINGDEYGEHIVLYYGNIAGVELKSGDFGYVRVHVDVDKDGRDDFKVVLSNSYVDDVNALENTVVELLVTSRIYDSWYVIEVITQPDVKDYFDLTEIEEQSDTTKIILK